MHPVPLPPVWSRWAAQQDHRGSAAGPPAPADHSPAPPPDTRTPARKPKPHAVRGARPGSASPANPRPLRRAIDSRGDVTWAAGLRRERPASEQGPPPGRPRMRPRWRRMGSGPVRPSRLYRRDRPGRPRPGRILRRAGNRLWPKRFGREERRHRRGGGVPLGPHALGGDRLGAAFHTGPLGRAPEARVWPSRRRGRPPAEGHAGSARRTGVPPPVGGPRRFRPDGAPAGPEAHGHASQGPVASPPSAWMRTTLALVTHVRCPPTAPCRASRHPATAPVWP